MEDKSFLKGLIQMLPYILIVLCGWKMTLGPGVLFFHKLKSLDILKQPILSAKNYNDEISGPENKISINAFQIVKIPFVQDFFFVLSLPCLYLTFFGLYMLKFTYFPEPDAWLLILSFSLIYFSCFKLLKQERKSFSFLPFIYLLCGLILPMVAISGRFDLFDDYSKRDFVSLTLCCMIQMFMFSPTPIISGVSYCRYTHPNVNIINYSGFRSVLLTLYSSFSTALIFIWNYLDALIVILFFIVFNIVGRVEGIKTLIAGCVLSTILSIFTTKKIMQLRIITLLMPLFQVSKGHQDDNPKMKVLLRPIGSLVFALMSLPVSQILLCIALAQCEFGNKNENLLYSTPFLLTLILNGQLTKASQALVSTYFSLPFFNTFPSSPSFNSIIDKIDGC